MDRPASACKYSGQLIYLFNGIQIQIASLSESFLLETGTPIVQADAAAHFVFALGNFNKDGIPDLYCLKKSSTGTGMLEVHVLSGADKYQSFLLETGTPITQVDAAADFNFAVGDFNRDGIPDLYCFKSTNTGTGQMEVHVLNGADRYQSFILETGTPIAQTDAAAHFSFAVGDFNKDGIPDVYGLKTSGTGTSLLEVHVLNGAKPFQYSFEAGIHILQPVLQWGVSPDGGGSHWAVASWFAGNQTQPAVSTALTSVKSGDSLIGDMTLMSQDGDLLTYVCEFQGIPQSRLQVQMEVAPGTFFECVETLEAYGLTKASDYPDTPSTSFTNIAVTPAAGLFWSAEDLVVDAGQHAEVVVNSGNDGRMDLWYGNGVYQSFLLETGTPIAQADALSNYSFAVGDFNKDGIADLYCFKKSSTGTGDLEVHVLSGANNYQSFLLETGTSISQADAAANFAFAVGDFNKDGIPDVFGFKSSSTGTALLEVHVLNGASKYQNFLLQTGTPLTEADANAHYTFAVGDFNKDGIPDIYAIKRSSTGTNRLEVHVLSGVNRR